MSRLQSLPHELLRAIVLEVDESSLHALSSTSQLFYYLTVRDIYRFLFHWNAGYQGYTFPLSQSAEWPRGITRQTRVHDLTKLLRTIEESPRLASYISAVGFHFEKGSACGEKFAIKNQLTTQIMEKLSNNTFFHVSPPSLRVCDGAISGPVTAVDFSPYCWSRDGSSQGFSHLSKDVLYDLFRYPTLRHLSLGGIRSWDRFDSDDVIASSPRTSNITALMLSNTVPVGKDLEEILTWPKALKTFHMETWAWADNSFGPGGPVTQILSPSRIKSALVVQKESLQEIYICGFPDSRGIEDSKLGSLCEFSQLKRLGMPQEFVRLNDLEHDSFDDDENSLGLRHCLPSSIEELQIELPLKFRFSNSNKPTPHERELADFLNQVERDRSSLYPNLKKLAIWQRQIHSELPTIDSSTGFCDDVDFIHHREFMQNILPFKIGPVYVSIDQSYHPPLFGKRERFEKAKSNEARCFQHSSRSLADGALYHDETERLMEWGFSGATLFK